MSQANKCDRCGALYEPDTGAVIVGRIAIMGKPSLWDEWSDIDLCRDCGARVIAAIGEAIGQE